MGHLPFQVITSLEDVTRNFEQIEAAGMFTGVGAPAFLPSNANVSYYFRKDTPTVANQRIYVFTGSAWVGIV